MILPPTKHTPNLLPLHLDLTAEKKNANLWLGAGIIYIVMWIKSMVAGTSMYYTSLYDSQGGLGTYALYFINKLDYIKIIFMILKYVRSFF